MTEAINIVETLENVVIVFSVVFAFTLGLMMLRLKFSNKFQIRDHVESNFSFDLDFKVIDKMRRTYAISYNSSFIPWVNRISFVLMIIFFCLYFTLMVVKAIA